MKDLTGALTAKDLKVALVVARFNEFVTDKLLEGALDALKKAGCADSAITVLRVPGAWEIPVAVKHAMRAKPDCVIAIGAVIRGGTPHFEFVSQGAVDGCMHAQMETGIPVALGILTCDNAEQALERAGVKGGNKGIEAAHAAIEMANLAKQIT